MATQIKVEPGEETSAFAASSHVRDAQTAAMGAEDDSSDERESAGGEQLTGELARDDEDVSIDELLISDGGEDDEPEDATEVHMALPKLAAEGVEEDAIASVADDLPETEALATQTPPVSEERMTEAAKAVQPEPDPEPLDDLLPPDLEVDESPEAAAARAAADQEAMAARSAAERAALERQKQLTAAEPVAPEPERVDEPAPDTLTLASEVAQEPAASVDVIDDDVDVDAEPDSVRAGASEAPLPSFDIPELPTPNAAAALQLQQVQPAAPAPRPSSRPIAPMAPLSEVAEDDDDAVTHIGLPVVPEASGEYAPHVAPAFEPAEQAVAAMQGFDPALSVIDARRAATRIIPRIDPSQIPAPPLPQVDMDGSGDTMRPLASSMAPPAIGAWLSRALGRSPDGAEGYPASETRREQLRWLLENVVPPVSLILFGSGIGAGILLLLQPESEASVAPPTVIVAPSPAPAAAASRPTTLLERAQAGEGDALFKITNMAPSERTSELTLALEAGYRAQKLNEFQEFARGLQAAPAALPASVVARLIGYATSPETMLPSFELLSRWAGPAGPDLIYAIWEKAPGGSRSATLAHQLLHSSDQRAKASAALTTALDLRAARTCDDYLRVLPAVIRAGDQRCSPTLRALEHQDGCGDDGRQDCYACLREGTELADALSAVQKRPAPEL